jgi:hypothetical protein
MELCLADPEMAMGDPFLVQINPPINASQQSSVWTAINIEDGTIQSQSN